MESFFHIVAEHLASNQPMVLATVVRTRGSTPQKTGAKALFLPDGRILGTIGGGCLEAETQRRAMESLRDGQPRLFELNLNDDFGWDDGLICGGTAEVFLNPNMEDAREVYRRIIAAEESREPCALATVLQSPDSEIVGTHHLVVAGGTNSSRDLPPELRLSVERLGTLCMEKREPLLADAAKQNLPEMCLPESLSLAYVEPILPNPVLFIAGAGHVGAALCKLGAQLGFDVVVADDRATFANSERLLGASKILVDSPPEAVRAFTITPETYIVIVTRGHRHDATTLRECVNSEAAYLGMIGSRRKIRMIFDELIAEGLSTEDRLKTVHSPIGLDIGAETVEEIAVSIAAELIQVRKTRDKAGISQRK